MKARLSRLAPHILPENLFDYIHIIASIVVAIFVYLGRALPVLSGFDVRGTLAFCFFCLPIFYLLVALPGTFLVWTLGYMLVRRWQVIPFVVAVCGLAVAIMVPIHRSEEDLFLSHRAEYEHLVQLVRSNQLSKVGCGALGFATPPQYKYLAGDCLHVETETNGSINIAFTPYPQNWPLMYMETYYSNGMAWPNSCRVKRLDEQWYVCDFEWLKGP